MTNTLWKEGGTHLGQGKCGKNICLGLFRMNFVSRLACARELETALKHHVVVLARQIGGKVCQNQENLQAHDGQIAAHFDVFLFLCKHVFCS